MSERVIALSLRVPESLHRNLKLAAAHAGDKSMNAYVLRVLELATARDVNVLRLSLSAADEGGDRVCATEGCDGDPVTVGGRCVECNGSMAEGVVEGGGGECLEGCPKGARYPFLFHAPGCPNAKEGE